MTSQPPALKTGRGAWLRGTDLIRHVVFFSARDRSDVDAIRSGLARLGDIPHSSAFEVSTNLKVDPFCDRIDVVVYAEFASEMDLAAYKAHPIYAEVTSRVRPLRDLRLSADIVAAI